MILYDVGCLLNVLKTSNHNEKTTSFVKASCLLLLFIPLFHVTVSEQAFIEVHEFDMCTASHLDVTHFKGATYLAIACKTVTKVFFYRWQDQFQMIQWAPAPQNTRPTFFNAGGTLFVWATVPNNTGSAFRRLEMTPYWGGVEVLTFVVHEHAPTVGWQMYCFEQDGEVYIYLPQTTNASVPADPPDTAHYVTYSSLYKWI